MTFVGATIRRVDMPQLGLVCIELRRPDPKYMLLSAATGAVGAAMKQARVKGLRASPFVTQLRRHLVGAQVASVETSGGAVALRVKRREDSLRLIGLAKRQASAWWLVGDDGQAVVQAGDSGTPFTSTRWNEVVWDDIIDAESALLQARVASAQAELARELGKTLAKLRRKHEAITRDLEKAGEGAAMRHRAELLLANVHAVGDGAHEVVLDDWETQEPVTIQLEPGESAADAANRLFRKAKKLERSVPIASLRLEEASQQLSEIEALRDAVDRADDHEALQALWSQAADRDFLSQGSTHSIKRREARKALPYRHFVGHDDGDILVGRGPSENDTLTLRVAAPHDLWLHARGAGGAHVVVRLDRGATCGSELLVDAATLAAHFSSLRKETVVDVLYTPRRYVRKRRGSPAGTVTLDREKVIAVRMEPKRLEQLLASERR